MEGSANSQNVDNYTMLSRYYDELLQDEEALSLWLQYIESREFHSVLELASGSGVMAGILKKKGYDVTASDISEQMREVSRENFDGEYLILNMADYSLDRKYDLILCICDSINYLYGYGSRNRCALAWRFHLPWCCRHQSRKDTPCRKR